MGGGSVPYKQWLGPMADCPKKNNKTGVWSANLAASWAAMLQTLLIQTKETEMNNLLTNKTSLTILLILQGGRESLAESASKQILESPSMMILIQPSAEARLMAVGAFSGRIGLPPAVMGWAASCDDGP